MKKRNYILVCLILLAVSMLGACSKSVATGSKAENAVASQTGEITKEETKK